jgi:hypothetical protein
MTAHKEPLLCANSPPMLDDMKTISMSELSRNSKRIAKDLKTSGPYRVRSPEGAMALMDWEQYEGWLAMLDLLSTPSGRATWEQMEREYEEGKGTPLDEVIKELGLDVRPRSARKGAARRAPASSRSKGRSRNRSVSGRSA